MFLSVLTQGYFHYTAWAWGDPHITTLDGLEFTFNGWGEYILMEINTPDAYFLLQGRTHPVNDSKATKYTGFAVGSLPNNSIEVHSLSALDRFWLISTSGHIAHTI